MRLLISLAFLLGLSACGKPDPNTLTIGTISGPETELVAAARDVAKEKYGLHIKIVEFNDYNLPNEALADGSLDANVFQHAPYLKAAMKAHQYPFVVIGKSFIYPTAIYSKKIKNLKALPDKAIIAIPNDPSNETRALLLLGQAGLLSFNNSNPDSIHDIKTNPKHLVIQELDAAQLPRVLDDVSAAVINTTFAIPAGLSPAKDGLFMETKDSPYANLIVARKDDPKKVQLEKFVKAFNSPEVAARAKELFGEGAVPAWSQNPIPSR